MHIVGKSTNKDKNPIAFVKCNHCGQPVSVVLKMNGANILAAWHQPGPFPDIIPGTNGISLIEIYPKFQAPKAPEHVDSGIAKIFIQAEEARAREQYHTAGMGLRKTLDIAIKVYASDLKGDLKTRIDALATRHDLTPAMRE
jgi:hypothetical protein